MTNENRNEKSPAFPPQVMQDSLGRIVVPVPGLTKLEYFAGMFMAQYISMKQKLMDNGRPVSLSEASIIMAKELLSEIEKQNQQNENVLSVIEK